MNTTITVSPLSVPVELAKAFAIHKRWKETLIRQIKVVDTPATEDTQEYAHFEDEEYPNPQTLDMWIKEYADGYIKGIFGDFPSILVAQELAKTGVEKQVQTAQQEAQAVLENAKSEIENNLVAPIINSLTTEVITQ